MKVTVYPTGFNLRLKILVFKNKKCSKELLDRKFFVVAK